MLQHDSSPFALCASLHVIHFLFCWARRSFPELLQSSRRVKIVTEIFKGNMWRLAYSMKVQYILVDEWKSVELKFQCWRILSRKNFYLCQNTRLAKKKGSCRISIVRWAWLLENTSSPHWNPSRPLLHAVQPPWNHGQKPSRTMYRVI